VPFRVNFDLQRSPRYRAGRAVLSCVAFLRGAVAEALAGALAFVLDGFVAPRHAESIAAAGVGADASAIAAFGANAFTMARIGLISVTLMGAATLAFGAALLFEARLWSWRGFVGATGLLVGAWPFVAAVSGEFYPGPFTSVHWTATAISLGLWYLLLGSALPRLHAPVKAEELATG